MNVTIDRNNTIGKTTIAVKKKLLKIQKGFLNSFVTKYLFCLVTINDVVSDVLPLCISQLI